MEEEEHDGGGKNISIQIIVVMKIFLEFSRGEVREGEVYLSLDMPALFTMDINGQMEDQDTGRLSNTGGFYVGPPIHTLTNFSNPTLSRPSLSDPGVHQITPGQEVTLRVPGSLSTSSRASTRSDWIS